MFIYLSYSIIIYLFCISYFVLIYVCQKTKELLLSKQWESHIGLLLHTKTCTRLVGVPCMHRHKKKLDNAIRTIILFSALAKLSTDFLFTQTGYEFQIFQFSSIETQLKHFT